MQKRARAYETVRRLQAAIHKFRAACYTTPVNFLRRHPFPVVAHFERVVAVSFAFPEKVLRSLVPAPLEIDTFEGLGFVTVALVWTRQLRPAGFPPALGQDFFLAGYRVFARMRDESGRRLRGLRILRSETDQRRMVWSGNLLTRYHYHHVGVQIADVDGALRVQTIRADGAQSLELLLDLAEATGLPAGSPFPDWAVARRFAGPMPFTFSPEPDGSVLVIEGTRSNWTPKPIAVREWRVGLFDEAPFAGTKPILANAFAVEGVPYRWERGRIVKPLAAA